MSAELLRDLARAKVAFQLRAIETVIRGPSPDRNPKGGDAKQGSVEDEGRFPASKPTAQGDIS